MPIASRKIADYDFEGRKAITLDIAQATVEQARLLLSAVTARLP